MKVNRFTNYAFRALIAVAANPDKLLTVSDIARSYDISENHVKKVIARLIKHGYLSSLRGRHGGVKLAKPATSINVGEVFRFTQTDTAFLDCFARGVEGCAISPVCRLKGLFLSALDAFVAVLEQHTLADLVANPDAINELLAIEVVEL